MHIDRLTISALSFSFLCPAILNAQVATDGTTGAGVTIEGPDYDIGADLGTQAGGNLFHSFEQFSIGTGESATFSGPNNVDNVIGRVTGGDISSIDGRLASTIQGADLWLLNPAGVVLGPNASLDLDGSFHVSTADELRMEDGVRFSAADPNSGGFSVASPESFGFLGADPAGITVDGSQLSVNEGETLSIIGGDVDIEGANLAVESGTLNVLAADSAAEADVTTGDLTGNADGMIAVSEGSSLSATGDGGGTIRIEGGAFVVEEASTVVSTNIGSADGDVGVDIEVETAEVSEGSSISTFARAEGRGGDINVDAGRLEITDGSNIDSETSGAGDGGDIVLASEAIDVQDESRVASLSSAGGDGGTINIETDDLTIRTGGDVVTLTGETAAGEGGDINIAAGSIEILAGEPGTSSSITTGTFGSGNAGDIDIQASRVFSEGNSQRSGAAIQTTSANPDSRGGQIRLDVGSLILVRGGLVFAEPSGGSDGRPTIDVTADSISISGSGSDLTGISLFAIAVGDEPGGIAVQARDLDIQNGGVITTSTGSEVDSGDILVVVDRLSLDDQAEGVVATSISTDTVGAGNAGQLTIRAGTIDLSGRSFISSAAVGEGNAGVVDIAASTGIRLRDRSNISTSTSTTGEAGLILIETPELAIFDGADITAITTDIGGGGTIKINADNILIDNRRNENGGGISTQATPGSSGNAGDIKIASKRLVVLNEAVISSGAFGDGNAGNISINANEIEISDRNQQAAFATSINSKVDEGGIGDGGDINIIGNRLILRGNTTQIAAENNGTGSAGAIDIRLADGLVLEGGSIDTTSANAGGGSISIAAERSIAATSSSSITTTVLNDAGNAGDIIIETPLLALGDTEVLARADAGEGGDIQITADDLLLSPDANINAEAGATGVDGAVAVSAPEVDLTGGLVALEGQFLDISSLLRERCAARRATGSSSFTAGTGGVLPADLDAPRLSLLQADIGDQDQRTILVLPCPKSTS